MAKRFTDSDKWSVKWFRSLRVEFKLAWLYLLDNCDHAGVIRIDEELADFQIGVSVDWVEFLERCGGRIARLPCGKVWVKEFIDYQYGELSSDCRAHSPAWASIHKHRLEYPKERVSKEYPKGIHTLKDKDKDKAKGIVLEGGPGETSWEVPESLDTPAVRRALDDYAAMRRRIKKPIKDLRNTSKGLKHFETPEDLITALEFCIANEYQGLKPEYARVGRSRLKPKSFGERAMEVPL